MIVEPDSEVSLRPAVAQQQQRPECAGEEGVELSRFGHLGSPGNQEFVD